jgi:DNA-binding CsgD family transcriptional regulator
MCWTSSHRTLRNYASARPPRQRRSLVGTAGSADLTAREREILELVAAGMTTSAIAAELWIAPGTVRKHLDDVFKKLGVDTRAAAIAITRGGR